MDVFSILLGAALGWYVVKTYFSKTVDGFKLTSMENKAIDGIYTVAAMDAIKSQGQGQADYIGSPDYMPFSDTADSSYNYVKAKTTSIEDSKAKLFVRNLEGDDSFTYAAIGDAVPSVVAHKKTYGTTLPGTNVPGAMQGV
jgi:hypothetical protein